ncbi:hypothetical protein Acr_00g0091500 [Actinidia rufa]|uniref:Uncharacterized protein n=1 Tax=Actinidia rufa TaxID=165716 RepID=A0A7J0DX80_9ERIC|nr:hypothetical protein Acr_00g0091500 [Actinidia rufa]
MWDCADGSWLSSIRSQWLMSSLSLYGREACGGGDDGCGCQMTTTGVWWQCQTNQRALAKMSSLSVCSDEANDLCGGDACRWGSTANMGHGGGAGSRRQASTIGGLSLYSKLDEVFAMKLGQDTTVNRELDDTSWPEGNLRGEVFSDTPMLGSRCRQHD